jgi:hypothetical protein
VNRGTQQDSKHAIPGGLKAAMIVALDDRLSVFLKWPLSFGNFLVRP